MYCSSCGKPVNENLNYCNSCGARIEKNALLVSNSSAPYLSRATVVTGAMGFAVFLGLVKILLDSRLDTAAIGIILIAYLAAFVIICGMLIGHVWKNSGDIRIKTKEPDSSPQPSYLKPVTTAQLGESTIAPASVTENTTRTLDEVLIERK